MNKANASQIIKAIAESIKQDPAQFHFKVNITGMNVSASEGSTGMIVSAQGGGAGSKTIGLNVSLDNQKVQIAKKTADAALSQQMTQLYNTLNDIAEKLNTEKLNTEDKSAIENMYNSLKNTWVPGVITSIVGNILSLVIGIST